MPIGCKMMVSDPKEMGIGLFTDAYFFIYTLKRPVSSPPISHSTVRF